MTLDEHRVLRDMIRGHSNNRVGWYAVVPTAAQSKATSHYVLAGWVLSRRNTRTAGRGRCRCTSRWGLLQQECSSWPFRHMPAAARVPQIEILERVPACARSMVKIYGLLGVCAQG
jgi:hypothetical protein